LTIATLMACLRIGSSNAGVLAVSGDIAHRFAASVIGVAARQAETPGEVVRGAGPRGPRRHDLNKFIDEAAAAEAEFRAALPKVEDLQWRSQMTFGPVHEYVSNEARGADLVVVALDPSDRIFFPSGQAEAGDLLMRLGRPALLVPPGAAGLKLTRALVCWSDKREARRAIADALPLLQESESVEIVEIAEANAIADARGRLGELGDWLARHKVAAQCSARVLNGSEASQLAAIAVDLNVDLVVAGAFGHSRLREWAFGGLTRDMLLQSDRCVLASH
jgi:nucleotide-binding universal stress UspA family protein